MWVETVELERGGVLVRAKGVDSAATGKVIRCERVEDGPYLYYQSQFHGRDWNLLVKRSDPGGSPTC